MPGQQDQQQAGCLPPALMDDLHHDEEGEVQDQVQNQVKVHVGNNPCLEHESIKDLEEWMFGPIPRSTRLPQPPNKQTIPTWVQDCYAKDEIAARHEARMLHTGVVPEVGMSLYLQLTCIHDASRPRDWARMMGKITHVFPPPEVGVYVRYEGQQQRLSEEQLQQLRQRLPVLPPSLFGANAVCSCCGSEQQVVKQYGAVHGQRIKARMWLSKMEDPLWTAQLGPMQDGPGCWDIQLVCNDNLENMWVLCAMEPAATADDNEQPCQPAEHQALGQQPQQQQQQQQEQLQNQQQQQRPPLDQQTARLEQPRCGRQQHDRPDDRRGWAGREQPQRDCERQWQHEQQQQQQRGIKRSSHERYEQDQQDQQYAFDKQERAYAHSGWKGRGPSSGRGSR